MCSSKKRKTTVCIALVVFLGGCGSEQSVQQSDPGQDTVSPSPVAESPAIPDPEPAATGSVVEPLEPTLDAALSSSTAADSEESVDDILAELNAIKLEGEGDNPLGDPDKVVALMKEGNALISAGKPDAALAKYNEALKFAENGEDPEVFFNMGIAYKVKGENLKRENLDPIEEAKGYAQLMDQFDLTQEEIATKVGKNRATVANTLRLIKLPAEVQAYVRDGLFSSGHAKAILGLKNAKDQIAAAKRVIKKELSVRQAEELVAALGQAAPDKTKRGSAVKRSATDAHILDLESKLQEKLGTKVSLRYRKGKGSVDIKFFNDEDLQRILDAFGIRTD